VSGRKWGSFHFDILKEEYLNIRMDLLKRILGEKLENYLEKTQPASKSSA
jgi:hypothetical protein